MILDIGGANTKVAMIEEGVLRSSHLITSGSQDITVALAKAKNIPLIRAEEIKREYGLKGDPADPAIAEISRLSVQRIFAEANRILEKYEQQNRLKVGKVLLSGGGALLQGITDLASASFSSSVIYGDPFDKAEHKPELNAVLKEAGPEFAVAVGLALRNL
jgi:Tfp pilus assembly PilM family ATPase